MIFLFFALGLPNVFLAFTGGFNDDKLKKGFLIKATKIVLLVSILPVIVTFFGAEFIANTIFEKPSLEVYFQIVAFGDNRCHRILRICCDHKSSGCSCRGFWQRVFTHNSIFPLFHSGLFHLWWIPANHEFRAKNQSRAPRPKSPSQPNAKA